MSSQEIKLKSELTVEVRFQAVIYALASAKQTRSKNIPRCTLFNVQDGQKFEVTGPTKATEDLLDKLLCIKYYPSEPNSDDVFRKEAREIRAQVAGLWGLSR
ncbi:hypothetical protein FB451DRAFT_1168433 [Mycena latifolia]|nr:hypothetical protein FB451DRAFT_1168433 [Mycena latifolia]